MRSDSDRALYPGDTVRYASLGGWYRSHTAPGSLTELGNAVIHDNSYGLVVSVLKPRQHVDVSWVYVIVDGCVGWFPQGALLRRDT